MTTLSRLAPALLAAGLGVAGLFSIAPAQAQNNDLARVIVDIADVVVRGNVPYYRHGNYDYDDRLIIVRDRYQRPTYYRYVPRHVQYRQVPRYGYAQRTKCNKHGKCKVEYYDPRHDRHHDDRYYSYDGRYNRYDRDDDDRRWDRRRHDRDDD